MVLLFNFGIRGLFIFILRGRSRIMIYDVLEDLGKWMS